MVLVFIFTLWLSILYFRNLQAKKTIVVNVCNSYISDVKNPKWALDKSDLIVKGNVTGSAISYKGQIPASSGDTVYTDNSVKVTKVVKNTAGKTINEGDVISVRLLGGSVDNITYNTETYNLLSKGKNVLLCLVDGIKDPSIPKTEDKQYFSIVGGIHGAYQLTSDGLAVRTKLKDSFKTDELLKDVK